MQAQRVRGRRAQLRDALRGVGVGAGEPGARHYGVRVRAAHVDSLVALDLRRRVWVWNKEKKDLFLLTNKQFLHI